MFAIPISRYVYRLNIYIDAKWISIFSERSLSHFLDVPDDDASFDANIRLVEFSWLDCYESPNFERLVLRYIEADVYKALFS